MMSNIGKKYELVTNEDKNLYRIKALRSFGNVEVGDIGGYVAKEQNLSHEGSCWIYDNARVCEDARVTENASVSGSATVYGNALLKRYATVRNQAEVYGNAIVGGCASIIDSALVYGNAEIDGDSYIMNRAHVSGNARVSYNTVLSNRVHVRGNAVLSGEIKLSFGILDREPNVHDLLRCSLGVFAVDGVVRLSKLVRSNLASFHNQDFIYPEKGIVECLNFDPDPSISCAEGLHFSTNEFWCLQEDTKVLVADIHIDDIICVLDGKVRCKKANIVGVVEL